MSDETRGLPEGFLFSQHSLNTYSRCKRRFWLRYVARLPWPVPEGDDPLEYEAHLERGRVLHQWIQRHLVGLSVSAEAADEQLQGWWQRYLSFDWSILPAEVREPELPVIVPLGGHRLYARYDLAALEANGRCVVVDWKTLGSVPSPSIMERRVQTRVYLYTLARAASTLLGKEVAPERISMLYWFATRPEEPVWVGYDEAAFQADALRLDTTMTEIARQPQAAFSRTERLGECVRCNYRTLCERDALPAAAAAAESDWLDEDLAASLDLSDVPEVPY